jgi:hypothetical protein
MRTHYRQIRILYGHLDNIFLPLKYLFQRKQEMQQTGGHISYIIRFYIIRQNILFSKHTKMRFQISYFSSYKNFFLVFLLLFKEYLIRKSYLQVYSFIII